MKLFGKILVCCCTLAFVLVGCNSKSSLNGSASEKTGWAYNNPDQGFFNVKTFYEGKRPYGMVYVPENTTVKGQNSENLSMAYNNEKKRIASTGFFMDEYEVTNLNWKEYVAWLQGVYSHDPRQVILALPDETVWRSELAYNEPFVQNYYSHVAYSFYPVVGVSWEQATAYCKWRTDRMNELVLLQAGVIEFVPLTDVNANVQSNPEQDYLYVFKTDRARDYVDENRTAEDEYMSTAELLNGLIYDSEVRLPTEAEWEYAAYGLEYNNGSYQENNTYPWVGGQQVRSFGEKKTNGHFNANFTRGRGDLIGISLNGTLTVPVNYFQPNGYGLYNMAGNVNEWVMDVYRASIAAVNDVNAFRGNEYESDSVYAEAMLIKYFTNIDPDMRDSMRNVFIAERGITKGGGDFRDFKDGDKPTSIQDSVLVYRDATPIEQANMITKTARVYKGGSWKDRSIYMDPSQRRSLEQKKCRNDIGFRCVMSIVGGNEFKRY